MEVYERWFAFGAILKWPLQEFIYTPDVNTRKKEDPCKQERESNYGRPGIGLFMILSHERYIFHVKIKRLWIQV